MSSGRPETEPDHLIRMIYGTLTGQHPWAEVLEEICGAFQADGVSLTHHDFGTRKGFMRCRCDHLTAATDAVYNSKMCGRNPWLHSDMPYRADTVFLGTEILPESDLIRTEFYRTYLRPLGLKHRLCGVVARNGLETEFITILRRRGTRSFGAVDKMHLKGILPHLAQALDLQKQIGRQQEERSALFELLDHIPVACLLVDQGCRVRFENRSAQTLLARREGLLLRAGQLVATRNGEAARLRNLIARNAAKPAATARQINDHIVITRGADRPPLLLTLFPVDRRQVEANGPTDNFVALLTKDPDAEEFSSVRNFAEAYGLTPAEERLIALLAEGNGLFDAARLLGVTRNTARTHIRHVYGKVGVHRQADIVRLLGKLSLG